MIKKVSSTEPMFYVSSAGYEAAICAKNEMEAASSFLEEALSKFGNNLKLSPLMVVFRASDAFYELTDLEEYCTYLNTPTVLANIGKYNLSKNVSTVFEGWTWD